ncbi:MAG: cobalt-precorrin-6A reductase, partial [Sulfitobacter sp.]
MMHILLLGGTTEASAAAEALAGAGINAVFSYAGRTKTPVAQPIPTRVGGFGGVAGLVTYLDDMNISHVIDATHPFAAGMSRNASAACAQTGTPLLRFERSPWYPAASDNWTRVAKLEDIPDTLPSAAARVFLAIGKQQIGMFATKPQHHYLLRLVDAPTAPLPLPHATVVLDRGPFDVEGDIALMRAHKITHVIAKNAGGSGARAKLDAARA